MEREIPGYYYDSDKKRYFKIEAGKTAPQTAAWSAENVKRRKLEENIVAVTQKRLKESEGHINRSSVLAEPLMGGFFLRELGQIPRDTQVASWAKGLCHKGDVSFGWVGQPRAYPNIPLFYVSGQDKKTGLGVVYATLNEEDLIGTYIPRDAHGEVSWEGYGSHHLRSRVPRMEALRCSQMSSMKYHKPSHKMLFTSREPGPRVGISCFSPLLSDPDNPRPAWLIGDADFYQNTTVLSPAPGCVANTCTPAPAASSNLVAMIGTSEGLLQFSHDENLKWIVPPVPSATRATSSSNANKPRDPGEIFSLDFLKGNPSVVFAGGRSNKLLLLDLRVPTAEWDWIRHRSSIAHVRSVNEHQVLVAGPRSAMCVYDIRFRKAKGTNYTNRPLVTFPSFQNDSYIHFGFDVDSALGVAATSHDDGRVAIYSLHSGRRLPCPNGIDAIKVQGIVKSLMFQTLPGDRNPSLFVGVGPHIQQYSFGIRRKDGQDLEE